MGVESLVVEEKVAAEKPVDRQKVTYSSWCKNARFRSFYANCKKKTSLRGYQNGPEPFLEHNLD